MTIILYFLSHICLLFLLIYNLFVKYRTLHTEVSTLVCVRVCVCAYMRVRVNVLYYVYSGNM